MAVSDAEFPARVAELEAALSDLQRQLEQQTAELVRANRELQDETVRHNRTEEALRQERHLLQVFMDNVPDNIYFKDRDSRFVRINKAAAKWYGLNSPNEAAGKSDFDLFTREHAQPAYEDEQQVIRSGRPLLHVEEKETWPGGRETWVDTSKLPLRDPEGELIGTFGISRDITEQKRAEISLKAAKEAAEAANRAKSAFLAHMSHEIRTPMAAVIGLAELLLESNLAPDQTEYARMILDSGESLLSIINDILDFSRIEAGKIELENAPFDVRELVGTIMKPLGVSAHRKELELSWQIAEAMPAQLVGDSCRLRQVLVNLVGNAIKFTREGTVHLDAKVIEQSAERVVVEWKVTDTGIGIPAEKLQAIFDEFEQADKSTTRQFGGTGLGLAIASRLVQLMEGRIHAESTLGQGSVFSFTVSLGIGDPPIRATADAGAGAAEDMPKLHVLLAEDNVFSQTVVRELLERAGHRVTVVEDGQQAVAACVDGRYDVVLMDVEMPLLDGLAATQAIRRQERDCGRHIPIVAMTAHALAEDRTRCLDAGMDSYLSKPIRAKQLKAAILAALEGKPQAGDVTRLAQDAPSAEEQAAASGEAVDWQAALESVGGDPELLQMAVVAARHEFPDLLAKVRQAIAEGDARALRISAHTLKGTLRYFGKTRAYTTAYRLELAARDSDLTAARAVFEELADEAAGLLALLSDFADAHRAVPQTAE